MVKNLPANMGDARDSGPTPGSGQSPREDGGNPSRILVWENPGTEEPGGLQSMGRHRVTHDGVTENKQPPRHRL